MASEDSERYAENVYRSEARKENPRYKDAELLHEMYVERRMSTIDIAEELDCAANTVRKYLKENDIELRSWSEAQLANWGTENCAKYHIQPGGRATWKSQTDQLYVYRLLAVAEFGFDAVCDKDVHHKNGIPWDNRPENLELTVQSEHNRKHRKLNWLDRLKIVEMYDEGASSYDLAPHFDVTPSSIIHTVREFDPDLVRNKGGK